MSDDTRESRERFFIRASPLLRVRGGPPPEPRASVTVIPVRDAEAGLEVLLVRRPLNSRFAAGAWIFPGGVVDPDDHDTELIVPRLAAWSRRLSLAPRSAHAHLVAAVRETWEETGVLLGQHQAPSESLQDVRRRVVRGELSFDAVVRERRWELGAERLAYFAHWITPEAAPRRYDTRFLLAKIDPGVTATLVGGELIDLAWWKPADAVEAARKGDLHMLLPTVHSLRRLTGPPGTAELFDSARRARVSSYLPEVAPHPDGHTVTLRTLGTSEPIFTRDHDHDRAHE